MKQIARILAFTLALMPALAIAQQFPQNVPANTVVGRLGIGVGPAQAIPFDIFVKSAVANSTITLGSTAVPLGSTQGTIAGLTLTAPTINGGALSGSFTGSVFGNFNLLAAGAATLKGNPSSGSTFVQDFTIQGLSSIASPSATLDFLPIYDHVAGTIKKVSPSQISGSILALANTWTGLNTFTATAGGVKITGNANITSGYQETTSPFALVTDITAVSASTPENAGIFNITSSVGSANLVTAFKRALSVTAECNSGSASCWGQTVATQITNGGTQRGGVGLEVDLNNFFGNFTGAPTNPYAANIVLTGQNTNGSSGGYASCAICIEFAQNTNPMWNYGIVFGPGGFQVFNTASISDFTNSPISIVIGGAHTEGIDLSVGTFSTGAIVLGNTQFIVIKDSGGTVRSAVNLNASNVFGIGDTVRDVLLGPHIRVSGSTPTFSGGNSSSAGCGTSGTLSGSDFGGRIVIGSAPTNTCTVLWAVSYGTAPSCTFTDNNLMSIAISATPSTTGFVIGNASGASAGGHMVSWTCTALTTG